MAKKRNKKVRLYGFSEPDDCGWGFYAIEIDASLFDVEGDKSDGFAYVTNDETGEVDLLYVDPTWVTTCRWFRSFGQAKRAQLEILQRELVWRQTAMRDLRATKRASVKVAAEISVAAD